MSWICFFGCKNADKLIFEDVGIVFHNLKRNLVGELTPESREMQYMKVAKDLEVGSEIVDALRYRRNKWDEVEADFGRARPSNITYETRRDT